MKERARVTTTLSTKGQVILPHAIRSKRDWHAGTKLIVEETAEGVLLRAESLFPATQAKDVYGSAEYEGPPISVEDMHTTIEAELKRRHARGRY